MKKSLFKRVTALMCCIALCVAPFMPAVYAVDSTEPTVKLTVPENVIICDEEGSELTESSTAIPKDNWQYTYADGIVIFSALEAQSLKNTTMYFYIKSALKPTITGGKIACRATISDEAIVLDDVTYWEVSVKLTSTAKEEYSFTLAAGVQKYNVTFPADYDNYTISCNGEAVDGMTKSYVSGDSVTFAVQLTDSAKKNCVVRANGVVLPETDGTYTTKITADTRITISVSDKTFIVTGPTNQNGFTYASASSSEVAYDGSFSFYVTPAAGYNKPEVTITGNATLAELSGNLYVISNITSAVTINVTAGTANTYSVSLPTGAGYTATLTNPGPFAYNTKAAFTVNAADGYEIASVTATTNGVTSILTGTGSYSVTVTGDTIINVTTRKISYSVTYTEIGDTKAYTLRKGATSAEYGDAYTFYVTPAEGFSNPVVNVNGEPVAPVNGSQYVIDIEGTTTIEIAAGEQYEYAVTLINGAGFTFTRESATVKHGDTFTFGVEVGNEYSASAAAVSVSVNGVVVPANENGTYTISNITENKTVTVSGLQKNTYRVTFTQGEGYTFTTTQNTLISSGEEFVFSLSVAANYTGTPVVKANGVVVPVKDGYYTITVTDTTTITVEEIAPLTFEAEITSAPNATVKAVEEGRISYNGSYAFTVEAEAGYRVTLVAVNGVAVTAVGGTYTVNNVTSNPKITVETAKNVLTVTYVSNEKNHTFSDSATFTLDDVATATDKKLDGCVMHTFAGWLNADGTAAVGTALAEKIKAENAEITLTAKFDLVAPETVVENLAKLVQTDREVSEKTNNKGQYRVTFRTLAEVIEAAKTDACVADYVTVTANGTLLANTSDAIFNTETIKNFLLNRADTTSTTPLTAIPVEGADVAMYNYYMNCEMKLDEIDGVNIALGLNSKAPSSLVAAGWMEFSICGNRVVIVSEPNSAEPNSIA